MLGDRQRGEGHAPARARWLVHLAIDQYGTFEHAGAAHVGQQLMALTRSLADAREHRNALIFGDHRVDQLHHQHGLADAGTAEHRSFAALCERREKIDHLDPGFENFGRGGFVRQRGRLLVDAAQGRVGGERGAVVAHISDDIEQPAQHGVADRHLHRFTGRADGGVARQAHRGLQRYGAHDVGVDMRVDLEHQPIGQAPLDDQRGVDRRQIARVEPYIDDCAAHRDHAAGGSRLNHARRPSAGLARARSPERGARSSLPRRWRSRGHRPCYRWPR